MQDQYRLACGLADSAIMEAQLWHHFASVEAKVPRYPCAFFWGRIVLSIAWDG